MKRISKSNYKKIFNIVTLLSMFFMSVNLYAENKKNTPQKILKSQPNKIDSRTNIEKVNDFNHIGTFKQWEAFSVISEKETICWISSIPLQQKNSNLKLADKSTLIVSIRLEKKERNELAYKSQRKIETEDKLNIVIDKVVRFNVIPQGKWAWLPSSIDEGRFILAAQKGIKLQVSGNTIDNKAIKETYSLLGFTDAYKVAFETCSASYNKKHKKVKDNFNSNFKP